VQIQIIQILKGRNINNRKYWLHQIRKKRNHQAAGGDGTYYNPITAATSTVGNSEHGNELGGYNSEVGNIYWIPYFKKYIVIEDINATSNSASSLDIWVGINSTSNNNISYYTNTTGDNIAINYGGKLFSYENKSYKIYSKTVNKTYTKWYDGFATPSKRQPNKYTFVKDIIRTFNNPTVNKYIYTNISAIGNNTLSKDEGKTIYAWLAPSGGFTSVTPDLYPIINLGYPSWDSLDSPISKLSNKTISDSLKNLSNSTLYTNFSLSDNAGLFCQIPPCLATGDNNSNPYQTASAEHYYLPT